VPTSASSGPDVRPLGALSRVATVAKWAAFIVVGLAVIASVFLMFSPVMSGAVACGKLAEYPTWEYVTKEQPLPPSLAGCGPALTSQACAADLAQVIAGISLVVAITLSLSSKLLRRAELAASAARRQRCIVKMHPGNDIKVALPGDKHHRQLGRVVQTLYNADEFDVSVTFDESATEIYAYRYNELKPVLVRG
jgi:hypothetical protein